ncbi:hypothetical protein [Leptospira barantonii]|uniref:hypothetical protein n=1 Tax=Leptospira barantonii TaxID=2023184 RepID=UPI001FCC3FB7|nr:hypothetical protein [Leptospira barantonii]
MGKYSGQSTVFPEFSSHCLEYRPLDPPMLNSSVERNVWKFFPNPVSRRISVFIFIKSYVSNLRCFLKKSTSEFSG